jgi:hypothetical protein
MASIPSILLDEIQALIDKKYNIIGAQMILDEVEE